MQFHRKRSLAAGQAADPDPVASPGTIPEAALVDIPLTLRNSDTVPGRLIFAAEGTAAQTISVEVWTLDDKRRNLATLPPQLTQAEKADRVFFLATAAPIVVTVGELVELPLTDVMPGPGTIYVRVTTAPAAASAILVAAAN